MKPAALEAATFRAKVAARLDNELEKILKREVINLWKSIVGNAPLIDVSIPLQT